MELGDREIRRSTREPDRRGQARGDDRSHGRPPGTPRRAAVQLHQDFPRYLRAGLLSWRGLLASYRPPLAFYDLDPADWRYSLETVLVAAKSLLRELLAPARRGGAA